MLFSLTMCIIWLTIKDESIQKSLINNIFQYIFVLFQYAMTMVINVHNPQWIPRTNGICVANHTSPIDIPILFAHNNYILVIRFVWSMLILFDKDIQFLNTSILLNFLKC